MNYTPHHIAISVRNLEASKKFYETLGFKQVHEYAEKDGSMKIAHLKLGSFFLEVFAYTKNEETAKPILEYANNLEEVGVKHLALSTENIEEALKDLQEKGLATDETQITYGETSVKYFFIQDPDGIWVEFVKDERY